MLCVEALEQSLDARGVERARRRNRQLVALTDVAHVDLPDELDRLTLDPLLLELGCARVFERGKRRLDLGGIESVELTHDRDRGIPLEIGCEQSGGGEDAGAWRNEQRRHLGVTRERVCVHGTRPTEGVEDEGARIIAPLDKDELECVDHGSVRDLDDAARGFDDAEAERLGAVLLDRAAGRLDVERDLAAQEEVGIEPPEDGVRVGHGRLGAAASVTDRSGSGAGAAGADAQQAARVDPCDRAAAGADFDEVDDGCSHRVAGEGLPADAGACVSAHLVVLGDRRPPLADEADLRRRAAHVEGENLALPELRAEMGAGDDACGRPRFDHEDRTASGGIGAEDATARLHDEELGSDARRAEPLLNALEVARDDRADRGVHDRCAPPEVLAKLGSDLGRERDRNAGKLLGEDRADAELVLGVDVGVKEANGDRFDLLPPQDDRRLANRGLVERQQDLALGAEPLAHGDRPVARNERPGLLELRVVERGSHLTCDLEQIAKAVGGDEAAACDVPLDDRVGCDGRCVEHEADLGAVDLVACKRPLHGLHEALGRIRRCRADLPRSRRGRSGRRSASRPVNVPPISIATLTAIGPSA